MSTNRLKREAVAVGDRLSWDTGWLFSRWTTGTVVRLTDGHVEVETDPSPDGSVSTHFVPYEVEVRRGSRRVRLSHHHDLNQEA